MLALAVIAPAALAATKRTPIRATAGGRLRPGEAQFKKCHSCHALDADGEENEGPNLAGVFGVRAGSRPGYAYSKALKASGVVWTDETLDKWLTAPTKFIPGSKMSFTGFKSAADRQAVIALLKSHTS